MDMSSLSAPAHQLHAVFVGAFYALVLLLLSIGVLAEYLKLPLGGMPQFTHLVGRAFLATLILISVPQVMNAFALLTDAFVRDLGGLNNFSLVLHQFGAKIKTLSISWVSIKDMTLMLISFLTFFILYVVVYLLDAFFVLTWLLLYVTSPLLIALYVLPQTAQATSALFKSMLNVCVWKIVFCILACLLWSFALSDINKKDANVDFLTAILVNLRSPL